jgi:3-oxoacyl-(acyl-carrier-protein) synthase
VPNQPRALAIRIALSNSFGFGGANSSLVLRAV